MSETPLMIASGEFTTEIIIEFFEETRLKNPIDQKKVDKPIIERDEMKISLKLRLEWIRELTERTTGLHGTEFQNIGPAIVKPVRRVRVRGPSSVTASIDWESNIYLYEE